MPQETFEDHPPDSPSLTVYDEHNLVTYIRLLDADEEGADWREVVQIISVLTLTKILNEPKPFTTVISPVRDG